MTDERPVVVGLLGATGSGKSTFLVAAHSTAQDETAQVAVEASDARQHALLTRSWDLLNRRRIFPEGTAEPVTYSFWLRIAATRSVPIEVQDHRGGVLEETTSPHQAGLLVDHLDRSDILVLVVDGQVLGRFLAGGSGPSMLEVQTQLKIGMLSNLLRSTGNARQDRDLPFPRVTVMVTKADEYDRLTGGVGLDRTVACLQTVFPQAFDATTPTLVCAVGVADGQSTVRGHLAPFAFAAFERLAKERHTSSTEAQRVSNKPKAWPWQDDSREAMKRQNEFLQSRRHADILADELSHWLLMQGSRSVSPWSLAGGRDLLRGNGR